MELLLLIAFLFAIYWLNKAYCWVKFKTQYPILSPEPPVGILKKGDYASFGKDKVQFYGISNREDLYYVFEKEDSIYYDYLTKSELIERLDAVYGKYGLKWKRVNN